MWVDWQDILKCHFAVDITFLISEKQMYLPHFQNCSILLQTLIDILPATTRALTNGLKGFVITSYKIALFRKVNC